MSFARPWLLLLLLGLALWWWRRRRGEVPAASYSDVGICWIPARNSTTHRPIVTQVPMKPTAGSATPKSPSQACFRPSRPTLPSSVFSGPCGS